MTLSQSACSLAGRFENAIASLWAPPVYIAVRMAMWAFMDDGSITVAQSDFANVALLLMAIAGKRRADKLERKVDELARVNPDVDDRAIDEAITS